MTKEKQLISEGKDEAWCEWFKHVPCQEDMITYKQNFCGKCGKKLNWRGIKSEDESND